MIPGAFEARPRRTPAASVPDVPHVIPAVPIRKVRSRSVLERIWRYVMRPTDTPPF